MTARAIVQGYDLQTGSPVETPIAVFLASATDPGFMAAADYVTMYGTQGSATSVGTGSSYVEIQSTVAILSVKNTARKVAFGLTWNRALASHMTSGIDLEFQAAWLDDDTGMITDLVTGIQGTPGATCVLTGYLPIAGQSIGYRATYTAASRVLKLEILQDAAIARSFTSVYWLRGIVTQVAP